MYSTGQVAIQQRQDVKNAYMHSINDLDVKTNAWKKLINAPGIFFLTYLFVCLGHVYVVCILPHSTPEVFNHVVTHT